MRYHLAPVRMAITKKLTNREFPGGPVVRTQVFAPETIYICIWQTVGTLEIPDFLNPVSRDLNSSDLEYSPLQDRAAIF